MTNKSRAVLGATRARSAPHLVAAASVGLAQQRTADSVSTELDREATRAKTALNNLGDTISQLAIRAESVLFDAVPVGGDNSATAEEQPRSPLGRRLRELAMQADWMNEQLYGIQNRLAS